MQTAAPDFSGGQFVVADVNSGKFAEVVGPVNGTQADQYRDVNHPDQYWTLAQNGAYWTITNVFTGKLLDSAGATASGSGIVENASSGSATQQWTPTHADSFHTRMVRSSPPLARILPSGLNATDRT